MKYYTKSLSPFLKSNSSNNKINVTLLGYWTCYFIEIPNNLRREEIRSPVANNTLYSCFFKTRYLGGDTAGPTICIILCVLISIIGLFGFAANIVNILVLRHSVKGSSLQKLLIILAGFDLLACFFAILTSAILQVILDNVNRSKGMLIILKTSFLLYSLGRTGSVFMTILVTVERYFVVVHHFQAKPWLKSRRPIVVTVIWLLLILLINIPWWLNSAVVTQPLKLFSKGPLAMYPALFVATTFGSKLYYPTWLRPFHVFIDFVLPFPLLLLFNGLLYRYIHKWNKSREVLTGSHVREMNAAKMFSILVIVLFSSHTVSVIDFIVTEVTGIAYRELLLTIMLAVTLNATINLFVYYTFAQDFREYFWLLIGSKMWNCENSRNSMNIPGRASPEPETILHESVRYTKTYERSEISENIRLLNESKK